MAVLTEIPGFTQAEVVGPLPTVSRLQAVCLGTYPCTTVSQISRYSIVKRFSQRVSLERITAKLNLIYCQQRLTVHLPEHNVQRPNDRHHIRQ